MPRTTFRARPSRAMSAFTAVFGIGIAVAAGASGAPGIFVLAALAIVAVHLYNTFSPRGIAHSVFEVDSEDDAPRPRPARRGGGYCRSCGAAASVGDRFCGDCGAALRA